MSVLAPVPGDPDAVRLLASRLTEGGARLDATAGVLLRLRAGAVWDSPAGQAFTARLGTVPGVLERVARRHAGAAVALRAFADALGEAQAVTGVALREHDEAERFHALLEDRAFALVTAGADESTADLARVRAVQREQVAVMNAARARHAAAVEALGAADRRCTGVLRALADDGLADPWGHRALHTVSDVGHGIGSLGSLAVAAPELAPLAAVADVVGTLSDGALLVGYGDGSWSELGANAGLSAVGVAGSTLRSGATAGARLTAGGVEVTTSLSAGERLGVGAARAARDRLRAARARFAPPDVGPATPSHLLGGPAVPVAVGAAPAAGGLLARASAGLRGARAAVRARADAAFLDGWRLASAGGAGTRRMYAGGVTLELAEKGGRPLTGRLGEGGGRAGP